MADVGAIAGKAGGKVGDYAPLIVGALLIVAAIYVYSTSSGSSGYQIVGATNNSAERSAADASYQAAVQAHDANVMAGFTALVGEATTQYNDNTSVTLGNQALNATLAEYSAQQQVARYAEQASAAASQAQQDVAASQAHAQQQSAFWGGLTSIFGDAAKAFGA